MRSLPPGPPQQETLMRCMFGSPVVLFFFSTPEVLSHAYSNGHRGVPKDPIEASFCTDVDERLLFKASFKVF